MLIHLIVSQLCQLISMPIMHPFITVSKLDATTLDYSYANSYY